MLRRRTRKLLLTLAAFAYLVTLFWLVYKMFHVDDAVIKFIFKQVNSDFSRRPKLAHKYPSNSSNKWLPPNDLDDLNDEVHGIASPATPENSSYSKDPANTSLKMWFMNEGKLRPEHTKTNVQLKLWPEESISDRIIDQLMYLPENYSSEWSVTSPLAKQSIYDSNRSKLKKILLVGDFDDMYFTPGRGVFWKDKCPVNTCSLVGTIAEARNPDVVLFKGRYMDGIDTLIRRRPDQVWILYLLESPLNTHELGILTNVFNWTASYRHDSEIVTPYAKFLPYYVAKLYAPTKVKVPVYQNYAANKSKKVAWFVSNCDAKNTRLMYAEDLSQYIEVDIYGSCGTKSCARAKHRECLEMLDRDYKYYLSFENSNCDDYITEKFFENGLSRNILPVVMGPRRADYERVAPPRSFIHVNDFPSPKELAEYLHILDTNDTLYNEYFAWKGTGEFINTHFWCRLCALLHAPRQHKSYEDMQKWWSGPGVCRA